MIFRDPISEIGSNFGILLVRARSRLGAGQHILCYEVHVISKKTVKYVTFDLRAPLASRRARR